MRGVALVWCLAGGRLLSRRRQGHAAGSDCCHWSIPRYVARGSLALRFAKQHCFCLNANSDLAPTPASSRGCSGPARAARRVDLVLNDSELASRHGALGRGSESRRCLLTVPSAASSSGYRRNGHSGPDLRGNPRFNTNDPGLLAPDGSTGRARPEGPGSSPARELLSRRTIRCSRQGPIRVVRRGFSHVGQARLPMRTDT